MTGGALRRTVVLVLTIGSGWTLGCRDSNSAVLAFRPVTDSALLQSSTRGADWPVFGRDYSNTRFSPLTRITAENVDRLSRVWVHSIGSAWQHKPRVWYNPRTWAITPRTIRVERENDKQISTPVVVNGVLFYTGPFNVVVAVNAATGAEIWRYKHQMDAAPLLCCGPQNRGIAAYRGRVYVTTLDAHLLALDESNGKLIWDVQIADPRQGYSANMAPLPVDGMIIVGVSGGEFGIRGLVDAYDAATGSRLWRFWTIPSPEQGGWWGAWSPTTPDGTPLPRDLASERADSAKYADTWRHGGGAVWATPAFDPALGLLFLGISNPAPVIDDARRPGDNLHTSSIAAVDLASGKLRWHFQMVPHDMWDTDVANPVVLIDVPAADSLIPTLAHASEAGWVYFLDRRTGSLLYRSEPFVPQSRLYHRPTREPHLSYPVAYGGATWAPSAYSPQTDLFYVLGEHIPTTVQLVPGNYVQGQSHVGGQVLRIAPDSGEQVEWGTISGIDVKTGSITWQNRTPRPLSFSGVLATAGEVVFYGDAEGRFNALEAGSGSLCWSYLVDQPVEGPPVTYEVRGIQFVAVVTRAGLFAFALPAGSS